MIGPLNISSSKLLVSFLIYYYFSPSNHPPINRIRFYCYILLLNYTIFNFVYILIIRFIILKYASYQANYNKIRLPVTNTSSLINIKMQRSYFYILISPLLLQSSAIYKVRNIFFDNVLINYRTFNICMF